MCLHAHHCQLLPHSTLPSKLFLKLQMLEHYGYDDIYESVGELNYSIRESTPIGSAAAATMSSFEDISVIQDISLMSEY